MSPNIASASFIPPTTSGRITTSAPACFSLDTMLSSFARAAIDSSSFNSFAASIVNKFVPSSPTTAAKKFLHS